MHKLCVTIYCDNKLGLVIFILGQINLISSTNEIEKGKAISYYS